MADCGDAAASNREASDTNPVDNRVRLFDFIRNLQGGKHRVWMSFGKFRRV
jgi:hypothetical protein